MQAKDYMETSQESKKHAGVVEFIQEVAGERQDVANAMWSFWNFAHAFDDLVDGVVLTLERKEATFKALHDFVQDLLLNPFVRQNAQGLLAMFTMALTRCLDGDEMEKSQDAAVKAVAPAVRCGDVDVLMHMVYLAGGWPLLRKFSPMRMYDVCIAQTTPAQE